MNDMTTALEPKSDQLNSDDLISGPRTIRITDVKIKPGTEQSVSIFFDGDNGKPWKSCKSMGRVLVAAWGKDASKYIGRSVTLYRDPAVKWAGMEVGGIRISHLSDIENPITMALTVTKGSRKPFTVKPLVATVTSMPQAAVDEWLSMINSAATQDALKSVYTAAYKDARKQRDEARMKEFLSTYEARKQVLGDQTMAGREEI
jgi:hypothetical protein